MQNGTGFPKFICVITQGCQEWIYETFENKEADNNVNMCISSAIILINFIW